MTLLHRYWLKEFLKLFAIIEVLLIIIFVFIDYLSRIDNFFQAKLSLFRGFWYVMLKIPFIAVQFTPAVILLSSITVFGLMNKRNELTILKASGISSYFLIKPVILICIALTFSMFMLGETLIPWFMTKANYIWYIEMTNRPEIPQVKKDIWIKNKNSLLHINYFNPSSETIEDISITTMRDNFHIGSRIDARKGKYLSNRWILENVIQQTFNPNTNEYDVIITESKEMNLGIIPEDIESIIQKTEEMTFFELKNYVSKVQSEGYDATFYQVNMHGKLAFPFICIVMSLAGAGTGMRRLSSTNLPGAIALGIGISLLYWMMYGFCISIGYSRIIPPAAAAWTTNFCFFLFFGLYLRRAE